MEQKLSDELKAMSSGLPPKHHAEVPEGYFEALPDQVITTWQEQRKTMDSGIIKLQKMITAAAVVTGICLTIALASGDSFRTGAYNEISSAETYEYILDHIEEFEPLIEQSESLAEYDGIQPLESVVIEDFLLEEMDDSALELFF